VVVATVVVDALLVLLLPQPAMIRAASPKPSANLSDL
jgi:hypothetical protein